MMQERGIVSILKGREVPILLNTGAQRAGAAQSAALIQSFGQAGVHARLVRVQPSRLRLTLTRLLELDTPVVAVAGGDGTISAGAAIMAGTAAVLVPVPLGTQNHFARRYGLATLAAVAHALRAGTILRVPVGELNGRTFVNNASCGVYAHLVRHRERLRMLIPNGPAALLAALWVLARRPLLDLELEVNGSASHRRTAAAWVGIGRNSLRLPAPGDAAHAGDLLELVLPRPRSRMVLLALAHRLWRRLRQQQTAQDAELEILRAPAFALRSERLMPIALDGEVQFWSGPLHFQYRPDALRVLCLVTPDSA
ncbi:MAG: diacylglycerol/lipid kinase family protein [Longimicrobiales bacterium]